MYINTDFERILKMTNLSQIYQAAMFPMPYWLAFTAGTPVIPSLYWDVKSAEQRWKEICCDLTKLIEYANQLAVNENALHEHLNDIEGAVNIQIQNEFEILEKKFDLFKFEIQNLINDIESSMTVWDVQHGTFKTAKDAMRDFFNDVTVDGYNIADYREYGKYKTVDELANSGLNVAGWAVANAKPISELNKKYVYQEEN